MTKPKMYLIRVTAKVWNGCFNTMSYLTEIKAYSAAQALVLAKGSDSGYAAKTVRLVGEFRR